MYKNLDEDKKDENMYKRHLFTFKKAFPNFMYNNLNSLKLSSFVWEAKEPECGGVAHEHQEETPHDFKGGGQDP
jgi:hypothetical protein